MRQCAIYEAGLNCVTLSDGRHVIVLRQINGVAMGGRMGGLRESLYLAKHENDHGQAEITSPWLRHRGVRPPPASKHGTFPR